MSSSLPTDNKADVNISISSIQLTFDKQVNIGTGKEISIQELSELIKSVTGFKGNILWDESKPNGTHSKVLNVSKINNLGWVSKIDLEDGIKKGEFPNLDPQLLFKALGGLFMGLVLMGNKNEPKSENDIEKLIEQLITDPTKKV